ncbi:hypothetical protein CCAX7_49720 [Capsulimonas corticalis]|uniref:Uncharacterized protein n=1 Tax=Capsulimonas corticalis TaxID=2219043 RepID=A0A402CPQ6_9BACT|nr:hypothetical protein [Capsulimonas corticalis]BDI32921.1 hypothetical protein CCAX7_49720 [Capsulimonas corticalis]
MRTKHLLNTHSLHQQTLRALVAAALGCGLAVTTASAQSMGSFGRRGGVDLSQQQGSGVQTDTRRNAPAPVAAQPAPAPVIPTPAPVRVAPPAPVGGNGFGQSGGGFSNSGSGYIRRNGVSVAPGAVMNSPSNFGQSQGDNAPTAPPAAFYPSRGVNSGVTVNSPNRGGGNLSTGYYPSRMGGGGVSVENSNNGGSRRFNGVTVTAPPARDTSNFTPSTGLRRSGGSGEARLNPVQPGLSDQIIRGTIRVTTPQGQRDWDGDRHHHHDDFVYDNGGTTIVTNGPVLYGGYYYGNYCNYGYGANIYPSVYTLYGGFPQYICNPSVIVLNDPYSPVYTTPYLPFYQPSYQVTYNETNYYTTSEDRASDIREGGDTAKAAVKSAYKDGTYQAAFADIAKAWSDGNIAPLRKHLRDDDTKISILLKRKYAYSIASGDFEQITRDALDRLTTVSFKFTRLRKAKNGDVTAYGKHVYRTSDDATSGDAVKDSDTVPFDSSADQPYDQATDPAPGEEKVTYVAYTLRHKDDLWYIIAVNSSAKPLVTTDQDSDTSSDQ